MQLQGTSLKVDQYCTVTILSLDAPGCIDSGLFEGVAQNIPYTYVGVGAGAGIGGISILIAIIAVVIAVVRRRRARKLIIQ